MYWQVKSDYEAFYRDALRYLGCVDIAAMPGTYNIIVNIIYTTKFKKSHIKVADRC